MLNVLETPSLQVTGITEKLNQKRTKSSMDFVEVCACVCVGVYVLVCMCAFVFVRVCMHMLVYVLRV